MDAQLKRLLIGMVGLMLGVGSCSIGAPPVPTSDNGAAALTLTSLVQTVTAQAATASVDLPSTLSTEGFPTATELPPTVLPTASPIIFTPTFSVRPSPSVPVVSVTTGTNCRTGPGQVYDIIGGAPVGIQFVLVGKNTATNYWIIRLQDGRECWLWGQYAVIEGNVAALPEYAIPPTPLPPVGSIAGTITDYTGAKLSGVMVQAVLAGRTFTTGTDGGYSFGNLAVGTEFIAVDASAYNPEVRPATVSKGSTVTVNIELNDFTPAGSLETVEGRVLINSSPAVGANVWIWGENAQAITDGNGRYRIDLKSGTFLVVAQLGSFRGAVEVQLPFRPPPAGPNTTIAPDIILLPR